MAEILCDLCHQVIARSSELDRRLTQLHRVSFRHLDSVRDRFQPASTSVSVIRGNPITAKATQASPEINPRNFAPGPRRISPRPLGGV